MRKTIRITRKTLRVRPLEVKRLEQPGDCICAWRAVKRCPKPVQYRVKVKLVDVFGPSHPEKTQFLCESHFTLMNGARQKWGTG
jgi:hypothetical protein